MALAEAAAGLTLAQNKLEITKLKERALRRMIKDELNKQKNIEDISYTASTMLQSCAKPEHLNPDWINFFFERSKFISDVEMQNFWTYMLACEANAPQSFSKQTISLVSTFEKADFEAFIKFFSCVWIIEQATPMVFNLKNPIFQDTSFHFPNLHHLENLGLVKIGTVSHFSKGDLNIKYSISYYEKTITLKTCFVNNPFPLRYCVFTRCGSELFKSCGSTPSQEQYQHTINEWKKLGWVS